MNTVSRSRNGIGIVVVLAVLALIGPREAVAQTITATATGDADPAQVACDQDITNDDFLVHHNTGPVCVPTGDGIDEVTTWTFDFTGDPDFAVFPVMGPLSAAPLTLTLRPGNAGIQTDLVCIVDPTFTNCIGGILVNTPTIQSLPVGVQSTVQIDLLDFYSSSQILAALVANGGTLPMLYHDDAVVSFAQLDLVASAEAVLDHFKCYGVRSLEDFEPRQVRLIDQFEEELASVLRPVRLCNPVVKCAGEDCSRVFHPEAHLTCYQTVSGSRTLRFEQRTVVVANQFGDRQRLAVVTRDDLLCVPSFKAVEEEGE